MQTISLIWGILAILGMLAGFIPCFGWMNWLNIPFAVLGVIVGAIGLATGREGNKGGAVGGLVCCLVAIGLGVIRLALGGGVL